MGGCECGPVCIYSTYKFSDIAAVFRKYVSNFQHTGDIREYAVGRDSGEPMTGERVPGCFVQPLFSAGDSSTHN